MRKLTTTLLLLFLMSVFHSFAENTENTILVVEDIDDTGLLIKLNDGSEWEITYFGGGWKLFGWGWTEQWRISHWTLGDTIEIRYPGSGNFTDFILVIYNTSRNEHALAYLKQAPSTDYSACLWVMDFDESTNRVTLSNGTIWHKTKIDMYGTFFHFKPSPPHSWKAGDAITLIRGEERSNSNSFLLWNHLTNELPCVNRID